MSLHGYTVFRQTDPEKREMVKKFVQFMTSSENTKTLAHSNSAIPARKSAAYESGNSDREIMNKLLNKTPLANIGTVSPYYADVRQLWFPSLQAALSDTKMPGQAIDDFTQKANALIQEKINSRRK